ncbi:hypothetical protein [Aquimarina pacifica]|uniref:hypothetical protein n=1 Tax=Aquimarina pacifica TaxID=1296415 RepID=UPI000471EE05|nr:hypothetical protein [Aquimarina pacifica]
MDVATYHVLLNEKLFQVKHNKNITIRALHSWRANGLLEDSRQDTGSGNRNYFSAIDLVWVSTIADMRDMKVERTRIQQLREGIFRSMDIGHSEKYPAIEYYMMHIFEWNIPIFMLLTDKNEVLLLDDKAYFDRLASGELQNHICISLNKQIKDTLHEIYLPPDFREFSGLTDQEKQVLFTLRAKRFKYVNITLTNGEIRRLEGTEEVPLEMDIGNLLKQGNYQNIEIKQHNGKVMCINRTLRKNFGKKS